MKSEVQVGREHYEFSFYVDQERWISYYYQITEAIDSGCKNILYIGKGDGIVCGVLQNIIDFQGGGRERYYI